MAISSRLALWEQKGSGSREEDRSPPLTSPPLPFSIIPGGFIKQLVRQNEKESKALRILAGGDAVFAPRERSLPPLCPSVPWQKFQPAFLCFQPLSQPVAVKEADPLEVGGSMASSKGQLNGEKPAGAGRVALPEKKTLPFRIGPPRRNAKLFGPDPGPAPPPKAEEKVPLAGGSRASTAEARQGPQDRAAAQGERSESPRKEAAAAAQGRAQAGGGAKGTGKRKEADGEELGGEGERKREESAGRAGDEALAAVRRGPGGAQEQGASGAAAEIKGKCPEGAAKEEGRGAPEESPDSCEVSGELPGLQGLRLNARGPLGAFSPPLAPPNGEGCLEFTLFSCLGLPPALPTRLSMTEALCLEEGAQCAGSRKKRAALRVASPDPEPSQGAPPGLGLGLLLGWGRPAAFGEGLLRDWIGARLRFAATELKPDMGTPGLPPGIVRARLDADGSIVEVAEGEVQKANPPSLDYTEDLAALVSLNEASVLHVLRQRYQSQLPYTFSGPHLVALRPVPSTAFQGRRHRMSPHVFAVAQRAYWGMLAQRQDQAIVALGRSNTGKTTACQDILEHLVATAGSVDNRVTVEKIQAVFTVLRAFGTVSAGPNRTATRFSMVLALDFSASGHVTAAHLQTMLLERARVAQQPEGEGTFNVFSQMLAGLGMESTLHLHQVAESSCFGIRASLKVRTPCPGLPHRSPGWVSPKEV
uniref:Myosin motor domain-containing protein n=1 Tax=Pseudonaja textilis TaxID=8673 RepID=A0A670ZYD6_PSETE